jgi:formiminotetrahydrofolate cyclodeaminase
MSGGKQEELASMVKSITFGDAVYDRSDLSPEDVSAWLDNLTKKQSKLMDEVIKEFPLVEFRETTTCPHCQHKQEVVLQGLSDFFG